MKTIIDNPTYVIDVETHQINSVQNVDIITLKDGTILAIGGGFIARYGSIDEFFNGEPHISNAAIEVNW